MAYPQYAKVGHDFFGKAFKESVWQKHFPQWLLSCIEVNYADNDENCSSVAIQLVAVCVQVQRHETCAA